LKKIDALGIAGSLLVLALLSLTALAFVLFPWLIYRDYKSDVDTKTCIKRKVNKDKWEVKKAVQYCNATN